MSGIPRKKNNFLRSSSKELKKYYQLILLALPAIVIVIMFLYIPMYGVQIAFKDFVPHERYCRK